MTRFNSCLPFDPRLLPGLGRRIYVAISLFQGHQVLTLILAIYAIVTLVDALSAYLRARLV